MLLTDLSPEWLSGELFTFLCPHCRKFRLTCKTVPMKRTQQYELYEAKYGEDWNQKIVPSKPETCWTVNGAGFEAMSVTPSIDASASGHWHGFITDGEIVGGL